MTDEQIEIFAQSILRQEHAMFGREYRPPLKEMKEIVRRAWEDAKSGTSPHPRKRLGGESNARKENNRICRRRSRNGN